VGFADPFDEEIAKVVRACGHCLEGDGVVLHDRGTLVCMGMLLWLLWLVVSVLLRKNHCLTHPRGATIQHESGEHPLPQLGRKRH
jgi:hypothetical protein